MVRKPSFSPEFRKHLHIAPPERLNSLSRERMWFLHLASARTEATVVKDWRKYIEVQTLISEFRQHINVYYVNMIQYAHTCIHKFHIRKPPDLEQQ